MTDTLGEGSILADRYRINTLFARGDFSVVYLAHDLSFADPGRLLILKERTITSSDATMHDMMVRNFEREADLLATLSHPAIPRIHDYFAQRDLSYVVMEFIQGKDLSRILHETDGFLAEEDVARWAVGICDALQYLHFHRPHAIIHRDIKPQHAILDPDGQTHLVGFSIARNYQPGQKGTALGTSAYAAPEQYRGDASPRSDIYALGAALYHLLTKKVPSHGHPLALSEEPIKRLNPGVSLTMQAVVSKAMDPNPDGRFETAKEMKLALIGLGNEGSE